MQIVNMHAASLFEGYVLSWLLLIIVFSGMLNMATPAQDLAKIYNSMSIV